MKHSDGFFGSSDDTIKPSPSTIVYPEVEALRYLIAEQKKDIERLKTERDQLLTALQRVMNSDLVTTTQFNDYSEAFSNAHEVLGYYR